MPSDPVNGIGFGGEGSIYFNGKRNDPFFNYTAYRAKIVSNQGCCRNEPVDFVKLVLIAILIASRLAYYSVNKWLENFTYRIEISWWVFVVAGVSAIVVAMITVSVQAIKAAVANPVNSLQTE